MKLQWSKWLVVVSLLAGGLIAGCGGKSQPNEKVADSAIVVPTLFRQNCISCHGNQLQGRVGPNLQTVGNRLTEDEFIELIRDGKGGMPAYGKRLSREEIASIATWLSEQK